MSTSEIIEAKKWIADGAIVLDVRTVEEFSEGHLPQALHIPVQDLEKRLSELNRSKTQKIVAYCKSGQRSEYAKVLMLRHGFTSVLNGGGIDDLT